MHTPHTHAHTHRLVYNETLGKWHPPAGVQIRVPDYDTGYTSSLEYLDPHTKFLGPTTYFHDMVEYFVNAHKYVRGVTIMGAPYDWRFAPGVCVRVCGCVCVCACVCNYNYAQN